MFVVRMEARRVYGSGRNNKLLISVDIDSRKGFTKPVDEPNNEIVYCL